MSDYWFPYLVTLLMVSAVAVVFIENSLQRLVLRTLSPPPSGFEWRLKQHGELW
jgi:hypothetical protein